MATSYTTPPANATPAQAEPVTARGAIIIPTAEGPKVFTLTMENPENISPDDIFSGEPTFLARMRGQMPGPDLLNERIKYQTSIWRTSKSKASVYMFTNYLFINECVYPLIKDGAVKFKLLVSRNYKDGLARSRDRGDIIKYGDKVPSDGVLPNVECFLKASDFGFDGFLNVIRFAHEDGGKLNFDQSSIGVRLSSVGVVLDKIPKLYKIPVHNMHSHGDWCFSASSAVALRRNPFNPTPSALFHDLVHSPSNADLEDDPMSRISAEYLGDMEQSTLPLFKLCPDQNFQPTLVNMTLPPIWGDLNKF